MTMNGENKKMMIRQQHDGRGAPFLYCRVPFAKTMDIENADSVTKEWIRRRKGIDGGPSVLMAWLHT